MLSISLASFIEKRSSRSSFALVRFYTVDRHINTKKIKFASLMQHRDFYERLKILCISFIKAKLIYFRKNSKINHFLTFVVAPTHGREKFSTTSLVGRAKRAMPLQNDATLLYIGASVWLSYSHGYAHSLSINMLSCRRIGCDLEKLSAILVLQRGVSAHPFCVCMQMCG